MKDYKCTFVKYLWKDADTKRLYNTLEKEVFLPFPPVGNFEVTEGKWFSGQIERIVWDNKAKEFTIKVIDVTPKEGVTAELLLEMSLKQGWSIRDS